jgi:hypothetical protein
MTNRSDRGSGKPRGAERFERDDVIRDRIRGLHQGQQPCSAARTGRTHGCTDRCSSLHKALASQGPSTHGSTTTSLHSYAGAGAVHPITSDFEALLLIRAADHFDDEVEIAGFVHELEQIIGASAKKCFTRVQRLRIPSTSRGGPRRPRRDPLPLLIGKIAGIRLVLRSVLEIRSRLASVHVRALKHASCRLGSPQERLSKQPLKCCITWRSVPDRRRAT